MQNPFKQINDLAMDRSRHHERLIHLEMFQHKANARLSVLEEDTISLDALKRLIARIETLEKQAKPPVGLDGPTRPNAKGYIAPGGIKERILDLLRQEGVALSPEEVASHLGEERSSIQSIMSKLLQAGHVQRPARGLYRITKPAIPARAVGQRNGR